MLLEATGVEGIQAAATVLVHFDANGKRNMIPINRALLRLCRRVVFLLVAMLDVCGVVVVVVEGA